MKSFHLTPRKVVAASAVLVGLVAVVGVVPWRLVAAEAPARGKRSGRQERINGIGKGSRQENPPARQTTRAARMRPPSYPQPNSTSSKSCKSRRQ